MSSKQEEYSATLAYAYLLHEKLAALPDGSQEFDVYIPSGFDLRTCTSEEDIELIGPHTSGASSPKRTLKPDCMPDGPPDELLLDGLHTLVFRMSCRLQQRLGRK